MRRNDSKKDKLVLNSNQPFVHNDIEINNYTPFDVNNGIDNLSRAFKNELARTGIRVIT